MSNHYLLTGSEPHRGDVVVFKSPVENSVYIKRLVGLPGDSVQLLGEELLINGKRISSEVSSNEELTDMLRSSHLQKFVVYKEALPDSNAHDILVKENMYKPNSFGPIIVPANAYFMLGDNRDNSKDSRYIGSVPRGNLMGKALFIPLSVNPDNLLNPRWHRFGRLL